MDAFEHLMRSQAGACDWYCDCGLCSLILSLEAMQVEHENACRDQSCLRCLPDGQPAPETL